MTSATHQEARRATQIATLLVLVLVPALGMFRIDLAAGALMLLGVPVKLRDFPVIAGLAIVIATAPLLMVTTLGTFWCGWACPQNTLSEWANRLTRRLLGSRADVSVEGAGLRVAPSKDRVRNWLALALAFAGVSLVLGLVPMFYFFPPGVVWSLVTSGESAQFSGFMLRLYFVAVAAVFVDIALVRYFLCNYVCLYRFGTLLFRNRDLLRVRYDSTRAAECAKCNFCRVACVTAIDPTHIGAFDRCINCAECIDACQGLHARRAPGTTGLLRFERGSVSASRAFRNGWDRAATLVGWHGLLFVGGCVLLAYGLFGS